MYNHKSVSVVMSTYREKKSIRKIIEDFFNTGFVDEIIIVDNNSEEGTLEEVNKTKAIIIPEKRQGYGFGYQTGIKNAKGDYIVLCEPDGSYVADDIEKFLIYAKGGFEAVFGSRIAEGTPFSRGQMDFIRKYTNTIEAKVIELLFNSSSLTDVGCTYKLFSRKTINKFTKLWKLNNSLFATELILLAASQKVKFIEIPVLFKERVGVSSLTNKWYKLMKWGIYIQIYIFAFFLNTKFKKIYTKFIKSRTSKTFLYEN